MKETCGLAESSLNITNRRDIKVLNATLALYQNKLKNKPYQKT